MNYTTAYHELNEGLLTFQKAAAQDKKLLSKIDDIFWTINADSTIAPATKELKSAKAQADGIIAEKKKEVDEIQKQIKEYDTFINTLEKNKIQLVKQDDLTTTISSPLIKGNTSTQQLINSQENPDTTYLALNKSLVQGYSEALNASTPEALNMTTDTYTKSQKLLANLNQQIASTSQRSSSSSFKLQALSQSPQARLADCPNCEGNAVPQNGYQQDISAYVQGIFIQT
jgi:septal ring factor EnvC (AmiA/AmiB activator)